MAGAVPQQRGGSNATTIGMVVSIIVAVLLLGALIWLITQQEQLRTNAEQATAVKNRLVKGNDEAVAKQMFPDSGGPGKTLVGEMNKGIALICGGMTGNQNDSPTTARGKLEAALEKIRSSENVPYAEKISSEFGAVAVIENLYQLYVDEKSAHQKAESDLSKANKDLDTARASNEELQQKLAADLARMRSKVEELQTAKSEFETLKSGETQALANQIGAKQDALDALRRDQVIMKRQLVSELGQRDKLLDEQREALTTLRGPGPESAQELAIARKGVGRVLRALPGDSLVHIDLGREDNVTLGLTFSVYSEDERVPADGRGKANLEVVSVGRRTAECRVTARPAPDDPILEGDIVGNIVLSREHDKKQKFCIVGQFDIDFDGTPDVAGKEAIAALVRRYGGVVVDRVDPTTDYVIVGQEPPLIGEPAAEEKLPVEPATPAKPKAAPKKAEKESTDEESAAAEEQPSEEENQDAAEKSDDESGEKAEEADQPKEPEEEPAAEAGSAPSEDAEAQEPEEEKPIEPAAKPEVVPTLPRAPEVDTTLGPRQRRTQTERQRFDEAILRARMFSIPRLPQDRFFNFVGLEPAAAAKQLEQ